MRSFLYISITCLLLASSAPEPPLSVNAYAQGNLLVVTVFADAPVSAQVRVLLPPGWSSPQSLDVRVSVGVAWVGVWHLKAGVGLGVIRIQATDGRGNAAQDVAYVEGTSVESAPAQRPTTVRLPLIRH